MLQLAEATKYAGEKYKFLTFFVDVTWNVVLKHENLKKEDALVQ